MREFYFETGNKAVPLGLWESSTLLGTVARLLQVMQDCALPQRGVQQHNNCWGVPPVCPLSCELLSFTDAGRGLDIDSVMALKLEMKGPKGCDHVVFSPRTCFKVECYDNEIYTQMIFYITLNLTFCYFLHHAFIDTFTITVTHKS